MYNSRTELERQYQNESLTRLYDLGYNLIPLNGKMPTTAWTIYQTNRITETEIIEWANVEVDLRNWALLTGLKPYSNAPALIVLDADDSYAFNVIKKYCPTTPVQQRTGKGGYHFVYRRPEGGYIPNRQKTTINGITYNLDVRGDHGYILAPGSIHPTTKQQYKEINEWTQELIQKAPVYNPDWIPVDAKPVKTEVNREFDFEELNNDFNEVPLEQRKIQAQRHLDKCGGAKQGTGADSYCLALAICLIQDYALPPNEATDLLYDWGQRDDQEDTHGNWYAWNASEINHKINDATKKIDFSKIGSALQFPFKDELNELIKPYELKKEGIMLLKWNNYKDKFGKLTFDYIIDEILPDIGLTLFSGSPFSGKTTLVDYMIACLVNNEPFFKHKVKQVPILFFDFDYNHILRIKRLSKLADDEDLHKWFACADPDTLPNILKPEHLYTLITQPSLILIDTMRAGLFGDIEAGGENDNVTMVNKLKPWRKLAIETKSAIMLLHHNNRSRDDYAGAAGIAGVLAASWNYKREEQSLIAELHSKNREKVNKPILIEMDENGTFQIRDCKEEVDAFFNLLPLNSKLSIKEIIAITKNSRATCQRRLNKGVEIDKIMVQEEPNKFGGKATKYYTRIS
jgi:hypothetical protein